MTPPSSSTSLPQDSEVTPLPVLVGKAAGVVASRDRADNGSVSQPCEDSPSTLSLRERFAFVFSRITFVFGVGAAILYIAIDALPDKIEFLYPLINIWGWATVATLPMALLSLCAAIPFRSREQQRSRLMALIAMALAIGVPLILIFIIMPFVRGSTP